jgi:hypothetical protein
MITIITPSYRQHNIPRLFDSINFDKINKWIIVYDTTKNRTYQKQYADHPKILEVECADAGIAGNAQRNYGMSLVDDGFIYFLDDDNIIHPAFWGIVDVLDPNYFYTFDQSRNKNGGILYGNNIAVYHIDTAMFIVHKKHVKDTDWKNDIYAADGIFICDISKNNKDCHRYINRICCYYNYIG